ncbi:hypothetical protein AQUCO_06500015v1, partial [Aquilegia coerulea]
LVEEMRQRAISPYSMLITHFGKEGLFDSALSWLQQIMEQHRIQGDLSLLKSLGINPHLVAYNIYTMINVFGKAKLFREAKRLLYEMRQVGVVPDSVSYSTLIGTFVENKRFIEALSIFSEMKEIDMAKEADRLFWSMRKMEIEPNVVSYNTLLRVYSIHLFRLMQRKDIDQNFVTYNTMIKLYGKSMEHEKATNLVQEVQTRGIEPDA